MIADRILSSAIACNLNRTESMEYEKAIEILKSLLEKNSLKGEEKEAVLTAIGMLSWGTLSKSRIKAQKARRTKSTEW